jgi:hypothetical protein
MNRKMLVMQGIKRGDTVDILTDKLERLHFKVLDIVWDNDGNCCLDVEITNEFKLWFKERQGLKRWSIHRFRKFFLAGLVRNISAPILPQ